MPDDETKNLMIKIPINSGYLSLNKKIHNAGIKPNPKPYPQPDPKPNPKPNSKLNPKPNPKVKKHFRVRNFFRFKMKLII